MKIRSTTEWQDLREALSAAALPLLDVRSPSEFASGAVPGAVNVPLLDDSERVAVGTAYKKLSRVEAVTLGLEIFAAKVERFRASACGAIPNQAVAVHCARGGMRSDFVRRFLAAQGYRTTALVGGYKTFRQGVLQALAELAARALLVLDGRTGVGKSDLLNVFPPGFPLLDFEGLAHHRGSAFGDFAQKEPSPTQQNFENRLADRYWQLPPTGEILVEIETMIGPIRLPQALRTRILESDIVLLTRSFDDRVARLAALYTAGWTEATDAVFAARLNLLRRYITRDETVTLQRAVERRDFHTAVVLLLEKHYDTVYDKGLRRRQGRVVATFDMTKDADAAREWITERFGFVPATSLSGRLNAL